MTIKLPKQLGTVGMLRYMLERIIIQTNLVKSELDKKEIDYNILFTHIYTLHGYMNLTLRILKKLGENLRDNKE